VLADIAIQSLGVAPGLAALLIVVSGLARAADPDPTHSRGRLRLRAAIGRWACWRWPARWPGRAGPAAWPLAKGLAASGATPVSRPGRPRRLRPPAARAGDRGAILTLGRRVAYG
jgi:hypothetical protein